MKTTDSSESVVLQTVEKEVSFRASAHAGVGIPRFFELFLIKNQRFSPILGIATPVTSVTGSQ